MLSNPKWTESQESRIELQESSECEKVFGNFLEYLYTGKIFITHTNVMPILTLADKYMVKVCFIGSKIFCDFNRYFHLNRH